MSINTNKCGRCIDQKSKPEQTNVTPWENFHHAVSPDIWMVVALEQESNLVAPK